MMKKLYITTTLPYVNADLHVGHAVELVQADAYARYFRSKLGPEHVFFNSIIWQAMLASAKLPFSKQVLVHGTILGPDGRKMSKTIGNVVSPFEQVSKYNQRLYDTICWQGFQPTLMQPIKNVI